MLEQNTLSEIKKILFRYLNREKDKVFIFGSRAAGSESKFSDVDIGILSNKPVPVQTINSLKEIFEESDLPYTVDVVDFSTASKRFKQIAMDKIIKLN